MVDHAALVEFGRVEWKDWKSRNMQSTRIDQTDLKMSELSTLHANVANCFNRLGFRYRPFFELGGGRRAIIAISREGAQILVYIYIFVHFCPAIPQNLHSGIGVRHYWLVGWLGVHLKLRKWPAACRAPDSELCRSTCLVVWLPPIGSYRYELCSLALCFDHQPNWMVELELVAGKYILSSRCSRRWNFDADEEVQK